MTANSTLGDEHRDLAELLIDTYSQCLSNGLFATLPSRRHSSCLSSSVSSCQCSTLSLRHHGCRGYAIDFQRLQQTADMSRLESNVCHLLVARLSTSPATKPHHPPTTSRTDLYLFTTPSIRSPSMAPCYRSTAVPTPSTPLRTTPIAPTPPALSPVKTSTAPSHTCVQTAPLSSKPSPAEDASASTPPSCLAPAICAGTPPKRSAPSSRASKKSSS